MCTFILISLFSYAGCFPYSTKGPYVSERAKRVWIHFQLRPTFHEGETTTTGILKLEISVF